MLLEVCPLARARGSSKGSASTQVQRTGHGPLQRDGQAHAIHLGQRPGGGEVPRLRMEAGNGVTSKLVEQFEPPSTQRPMGVDSQREERVGWRMVGVLGHLCASGAFDRIPSLGGTLDWVGAVEGVGGHHVQEKTWPAGLWGGHQFYAPGVGDRPEKGRAHRGYGLEKPAQRRINKGLERGPGEALTKTSTRKGAAPLQRCRVACPTPILSGRAPPPLTQATLRAGRAVAAASGSRRGDSFPAARNSHLLLLTRGY
eukprot:SM000054S18141  [mRNA]  locus=s54:619102:620048:+ [translate_table: standard]